MCKRKNGEQKTVNGKRKPNIAHKNLFSNIIVLLIKQKGEKHENHKLYTKQFTKTIFWKED